MALKLSNNAVGLLALAISDSDTSLTLEAGHGSRFPALGAGYYFPITVVRASDPSQFEIMRCTARTLDTLTVERAQEGTSALAFDPGDVVELRLTAGTLEENFPQVEGRNAKNLRFSVDSVGGKPELKFKSGNNEETVVRQSDIEDVVRQSDIEDVVRQSDIEDVVKTSRTISTGTGLTGGGNLSANRTISIDPNYDASLVKTSRTISTGTGLTGGGNLSANRTISLANSHIPIGVGQTWQNVTGSRSLGTTYTNTTGRAIMVSISLRPASRSGTVTINVGGVNILSNTFGGLSEYSGYPSFSHSFIVPAGATYRISVDTSVAISSWTELR